MPPVPKILARALEHHQAGRREQAEQMYRQILSRDPLNVDALHLLGMLAQEAGRHEAACELIGKAVQIHPQAALIRNNFGTVLESLERFDAAVACYREALRLEPDYAEAQVNLGNALLRQGQPGEAVHYYRQALGGRPAWAEAQNNLGNALRILGRLEEAITCYREAVELKPEYAEALVNLGCALHEQGQAAGAEGHFREALGRNPELVKAYRSLGALLVEQGRLEEAETLCREALRRQSERAELHRDLAVILLRQERFTEAETCCREALRWKPDDAEAHNYLAIALQMQQRFTEAAAGYQEALRLRPDFAGAWQNLGTLLVSRHRPEEAANCCREALRLKPDYADAHNSLGHALAGQDRQEEAIGCYREALRLKSDYAEAHNNMGCALTETCRLEEAIGSFRQALAADPKFYRALSNLGTALYREGRLEEAVAAYRQMLVMRPDYAAGRSNFLFCLHYDTLWDAATIFAEHQVWARHHAAPLAAFHEPHSNDRTVHRPLRVGYLSPDFRTHPVAFFVEPILKAQDRAAFEVYCYSNVARPDLVTHRLQTLADGWREIRGLSDREAVELIRRDGIDILVDLAGHTADNRMLVFAYRPAPVAVTYLGYPDTTGLETVDYRLTDGWADPPDQTERWHTEELVRLPHCFLCYRPPDNAPPVAELPARKSGQITFGSFNAVPKITRTVIAAWSAILLQVPGSRLILKAKALADAGTHPRLLAMFHENGIQPERVQLSAMIPSHAHHMGLYDQIDIALDTFPYNGTATTCEALWMGVPVVALAGATHVSRVSVSLLKNLGLADVLAGSQQEYVECAVRLAKHRDELRELRAGLRERMVQSSLTDAPAFTRNLEEAYRGMWRRWCEEQDVKR